MILDRVSYWESFIMKHTNKRNPIARQLLDSRYRSKVVPNKKKNNVSNWLEEWEDGETEQDVSADQELQSEHDD